MIFLHIVLMIFASPGFLMPFLLYLAQKHVSHLQKKIGKIINQKNKIFLLFKL